MASRLRIALGFLCLFALYQSGEGIGDRLLHSFPVQAGAVVACVLAAWPISRWLGHRGFGAYALERRPRAWRWLAGGLLLGAALKYAALQAGLSLGIYATDGAPGTGSALLVALPMLLVSTFVPSIAEDILTRGFPYRAAGIAWRRGVAFVLASSLLYVANHLYRLSLGPTEWALLFVYGVVYATALWRTGSLWAAVGLHWGWNLGNAAWAGLLPTTTLSADGGRLLSACAHLVMLLVVLGCSRGVGAVNRSGDGTAARTRPA